MKQLSRYRAQSLHDETRLEFLPVIYVTATSDQAILLEVHFRCPYVPLPLSLSVFTSFFLLLSLAVALALALSLSLSLSLARSPSLSLFHCLPLPVIAQAKPTEPEAWLPLTGSGKVSGVSIEVIEVSIINRVEH